MTKMIADPSWEGTDINDKVDALWRQKMQSLVSTDSRSEQDAVSNLLELMRIGTKGSGNKGHKGRPGKVGGSGRGNPEFSEDEISTLIVGSSNDEIKMLQDGNLINLFREETQNGRDNAKDRIARELSDSSGTTYEQTNAILQVWAESSNDHSELSLRFQEAATVASEGDTELSAWQEQQKAQIDELVPIALECEELADTYQEADSKATANPTASNIADAQIAKQKYQMAEDKWNDKLSEDTSMGESPGEMSTGWRNFLDNAPLPITEQELVRVALTMREKTLIWMENLGLDPYGGGYITLFRGVGAGSVSDTYPGLRQYSGNAIESWSLEAETAMQFGSVLLAARVSLSDIFSTAITGIGCLPETEFVIFGGERDVVIVNTDNMTMPSNHW